MSHYDHRDPEVSERIQLEKGLTAHAGLTKSYICFSICKALQSLIFGYFRHLNGLIKSYFS